MTPTEHRDAAERLLTDLQTRDPDLLTASLTVNRAIAHAVLALAEPVRVLPFPDALLSAAGPGR